MSLPRLLDAVPDPETARYPRPTAKPLGELVRTPPNGANVLLRTDYLERGRALLLNGESHVGKSSLMMQAAIQWSLGRDFFGIHPNGPLRILFVQGENTENELAKMRDDILEGLGLTVKDEAAAAGSGIIIADEDEHGRRGADFGKWLLEPLLEDFKPDLLFIDPAYSYLDGDSSEQRDVAEFLRGILQRLIVKFNVGLLLAHHTAKPGYGTKGQKLNRNPLYASSGSAEWTNWPRAILHLERGKTPEEFILHAAKRPWNLGWRDPKNPDMPVDKKYLRHSKKPGFILWTEAEAGQAGSAAAKGKPCDSDLWEPALDAVASRGERMAKKGLEAILSPISASVAQAKRVVEQLIADGKLKQVRGDGRNGGAFVEMPPEEVARRIQATNLHKPAA